MLQKNSDFHLSGGNHVHFVGFGHMTSIILLQLVQEQWFHDVT